MQQAARPAAGAEGQIELLDQSDAQAAHGGVAGRARADDPPAHHQHVERFRRQLPGRRGTALQHGRGREKRVFILYMNFVSPAMAIGYLPSLSQPGHVPQNSASSGLSSPKAWRNWSSRFSGPSSSSGFFFDNMAK